MLPRIFDLMWIETGSKNLPVDIETQLEGAGFDREDRTDTVWLNLNTGASLVLACIGSWRRPGPSHFRLFHSIPGRPMMDVTFAILGSSMIDFDTDKTGSATYSAILDESVEKVSRRIAAVRVWEQP